MLRTLMDNLLDFVYIKDLDSRLILANAALAKFQRVESPQDMVGKTDFGFHPQDDQERLFAPFFRGSNIGTIRGTGSRAVNCQRNC